MSAAKSIVSPVWFYPFLLSISNILQKPANSFRGFSICCWKCWSRYSKIILWSIGVSLPSLVSADSSWPNERLLIGKEQSIGCGEVFLEGLFLSGDAIALDISKPVVDHVHQMGDESLLVRSPARQIINDEGSEKSETSSSESDDQFFHGFLGIFLGFFIAPVLASMFSRIFRGSWNFL